MYLLAKQKRKQTLGLQQATKTPSSASLLILCIKKRLAFIQKTTGTTAFMFLFQLNLGRNKPSRN
jgi:hypothetical protein